MKTIGETIVVVNIVDDIGFDIDGRLSFLAFTNFSRIKLVWPQIIMASGK